MNRLLLCPSPWAAFTSCSCTDGPVLAPLGVRWAGLRGGRSYYIACYPSETLRVTAFIYSCVDIEQVDQYDSTNRLLFFSPAWLFDQSWCFRIQSVGCPPARAASQSTCEEAPPLCHISHLLSNGTWKIAGVGGLRSGWLRAVWVTLHDSCNTHKLELCKG